MRIVVVVVALGLFAAPALAGLEPEVKSPYRLRVVVRFADDPRFTEYFRHEFKRELLGNLQASLGGLGSVELIDLAAVKKDDWPPLWKRADEKGLEGLDSFKEVGGGKTHFLNLDFNDGQYELQARQHDGVSGFVTPLVRKAHTRDRGCVARLAGLMIGQDFGLVATMDRAAMDPGAGERLYLKVKGGELGGLDNWVKKGEVFAVVAISRSAVKLKAKELAKSPIIQTGQRVDGALLLVTGEPEKGVLPCQLFLRYKKLKPPGSDIVGFRCVKLGTTTGPLRLQLIDKGGMSQKGGSLQVFARADAFPGGDREAEQTAVRDGLFISKQSFAHVAFARVMLSNRTIAQIPVELLDDRVEVRTVTLDPAAEQRDLLDADRRDLIGRLTDCRLIQVRCFDEITAYEQAGKKAEALARGETVFKMLDGISMELQDEIDKLKVSAGKLSKADSFAADCEQHLQIFRNKQKELRKHLEELTVSIANDNNPAVLAKQKKVQELISLAELLANQAEYDKALAKYKEAIAASADEPTAQQKIDAAYQLLKRAWDLKPGDAAHAAARKFILDVWPKLGTLEDVRNQLGAARQAFEKCKSVDDRLGINKMHVASIEVAAKFVDELTKLKDSVKEEEDRKTLETYKKVSEDLQKLLKDINEYLLAKK